MLARRIRLTLCLSVLVLTGCRSLIFGGTSARQKAPDDERGSAVSAGSASSSNHSSSSSSVERRDYKTEVIDILKIFQEKLREQPAGFDAEAIVSGAKTGAQLYLVTTGWKLHRYPNQNRVAYILSGRAEIVLDGSSEEVRAGHVIAIPAGVPFKLMPIGEQAVRMIVFTTPGDSGSTFEWLKEIDAPAESTEEEVETVEPIVVPDIADSSSSSEEFQTGTLTAEPDEEAQ